MTLSTSCRSGSSISGHGPFVSVSSLQTCWSSRAKTRPSYPATFICMRRRAVNGGREVELAVGNSPFWCTSES